MFLHSVKAGAALRLENLENWMGKMNLYTFFVVSMQRLISL